MTAGPEHSLAFGGITRETMQFTLVCHHDSQDPEWVLKMDGFPDVCKLEDWLDNVGVEEMVEMVIDPPLLFPVACTWYHDTPQLTHFITRPSATHHRRQP